jgi:hypothetical protein
MIFIVSSRFRPFAAPNEPVSRKGSQLEIIF